jgi:molybdopterin synthase catalytic subunit
MYRLVQGAISTNLIEEITSQQKMNQGIGAQAMFLGQVRADKNSDKKVKGIEYSAYPLMTEKLLEELLKDSLERFSLMDIQIFHSLGFVASGDLSLLVHLSSKHRKGIFAVLEEIVEKVKFDIPLWKKEIFDDNSYRWIEDSKT